VTDRRPAARRFSFPNLTRKHSALVQESWQHSMVYRRVRAPPRPPPASAGGYAVGL